MFHGFADRGRHNNTLFDPTTVQPNDVIYYDGPTTSWRHGPISGGGGIASLSELSDVTPTVTSGAEVGDVLTLIGPGVWDRSPPQAKSSPVGLAPFVTVVRDDAATLYNEIAVVAGKSNVCVVGAGSLISSFDDRSTVVGSHAADGNVGADVVVVGHNAAASGDITDGSVLIGSETCASGVGAGVTVVGYRAGLLVGGGGTPDRAVVLGNNATIGAASGLGLSGDPAAVTTVHPFTGLGADQAWQITYNGANYQIPLTVRPHTPTIALSHGNVAIMNGTLQSMEWSVVERNDYGIDGFSLLPDPTKIYIPEPGIWLFHVSVVFHDAAPPLAPSDQRVLASFTGGSVTSWAVGHAATNLAGQGMRLELTGSAAITDGGGPFVPVELEMQVSATDAAGHLIVPLSRFQMMRLGS